MDSLVVYPFCPYNLILGCSNTYYIDTESIFLAACTVAMCFTTVRVGFSGLATQLQNNHS
ncbi:hypothetical protein K474DRAFT_1664854 [Panus rudis PR-1116 ss-1]|nr:hypothetical protein K474DRAFT_1664854 [Panus rudis PR-1116 ss-1]